MFFEEFTKLCVDFCRNSVYNKGMTTTQPTLKGETMTTATIKNAIERSISHNEIVHITIDGDSGDALEAIREVFEGDTDYAMADYEGVDTMDVWGWTEETAGNEQDWRLAIRFSGDAE